MTSMSKLLDLDNVYYQIWHRQTQLFVLVGKTWLRDPIWYRTFHKNKPLFMI